MLTQEEQRTQARKVNEMHNLLVGNDEYQQDGLIRQVKKNTEHRKKQAWYIGFAVGIGSALGSLWHKLF